MAHATDAKSISGIVRRPKTCLSRSGAKPATNSIFVGNDQAPTEEFSYVQENLANPIRIADMALLAQLSPHHFCRTFRASLNETPHTYVVRMRVKRASALLRTTSLSLCRIAADCGFANQAHFNKLFRKFLGQSPGAWRRMQANGNDAVEAAVYGDWRIGETALPGTESRQRQRGSSNTGDVMQDEAKAAEFVNGLSDFLDRLRI
jgi:AraC-like DNA-binding protein